VKFIHKLKFWSCRTIWTPTWHE